MEERTSKSSTFSGEYDTAKERVSRGEARIDR